jgi:hypothetical protein
MRERARYCHRWVVRFYRLAQTSSQMKSLKLACALILILAASECLAGPADYVYRTYDNAGERTSALYAGSTAIKGAARASGASAAFGYGFSESWFSNLYVEYAREGGNNAKYEGVEWQNIFRLTHGQYAADVGLFTEVARPQASDQGVAITIGPLLETEFGRTQVNLNLLLSRSFSASGDDPVKLSYQWQVRHHWKRLLEPGLQGFGEMGQWNHWDPKQEQSHRLGPALFGTYILDERRSIQYSVAYLFETTNASLQNTVRLQTVFTF